MIRTIGEQLARFISRDIIVAILTHSFGLRYKSSIFRCSKNDDSPTRLYATCASSPITTISNRRSVSCLMTFSLVEFRQCPCHGSNRWHHSYMKEMATMPSPTTTIFCLFELSALLKLGLALPSTGSPCRSPSNTGILGMWRTRIPTIYGHGGYG